MGWSMITVLVRKFLLPLYPFKCKECGSEILKQLPFFDIDQHKQVYPCECGSKMKRGWKYTTVRRKNVNRRVDGRNLDPKYVR